MCLKRENRQWLILVGGLCVNLQADRGLEPLTEQNEMPNSKVQLTFMVMVKMCPDWLLMQH